jgi:TolA-binding protein
MAKKKKVSRKKLLKEPDEFLTISSKVLGFMAEKKIQLSWAAGIIILIIFLIVGVQYSIRSAENKAFNMLDRLMVTYNSAIEEKGPEKAYLDVEKDFQTLVDKYGGRRGGQYARFIFGDICFKAGEYDKAIAMYQQALKDFKHVDPFENLILKSLGYSYEGKKDFSAAVTVFEKFLTKPDSLMKDEALFVLARTYTKMGQAEKGIDTYRQLITDYPDSIFIQVVKDKVSS